MLLPLLHSISRSYPFIKGRGRLANSKLWKNSIKNIDQIVCTQTIMGDSLFVYSQDFVGRMIYFFGDLDPKITWVCEKVLRKGDMVFDIGANVGIISTITAKLVGNEGRVYAFEPQPNLVDLLAKSIEINNYSQILIEAIALSNHQGEMTLNMPKNNYGKASLSRNYNNSEVIQVPVFTLSDYFKDTKFDSIRLVKIDVEGHEKEVIEGALNLFKQMKPEIIIFELNESNQVPFWQEKLIKLLDSLEYEFFAILNTTFKVKLKKITKEQISPINSNDIVAISKIADTNDLYQRLEI